jgi:uncharacterized protein (DUF1330 family)
MAYEIHVGIKISDQAGYQAYRDGMMPILQHYQGEFVFDVTVDQTLTNALTEEVERVFIIRFPDEAHKNNFFADPDYQAVRKAHFESSVSYSSIFRAHTVDSFLVG